MSLFQKDNLQIINATSMRVTRNSICHELNYLPYVSAPYRTLLTDNYCLLEQTFHHKPRSDLGLFF